MQKVSFASMPLMVKVAVGLAFMSSWILFEDDVVDKTGLWHFMPLYRVGLPCVWDLAAAVTIVVLLVVSSRRASTVNQQ